MDHEAGPAGSGQSGIVVLGGQDPAPPLGRSNPGPEAGRQLPGILARARDGRGQDPARPVLEARQEGGDSRVSGVRHERRVRAEAPDPVLEHVDDRGPVGEDVRVVPVGVQDHPDRGPVRIEVAGIFVRLDDERAARPTEPDDRWFCRRSARPAGALRRTPRDPRRPCSAGGPASRSWSTCRGFRRRPGACRPGRPPHRRSAAGSSSPGCPAACAAASSGWSGLTEVRALLTAIRSTTGRPSRSTTWPGRAARRSGSRPPRLPGCRPTARPSRSPTSGHRRPGRAGATQPQRCRRPRSRGSVRPPGSTPAGRLGSRPRPISSTVRVTRDPLWQPRSAARSPRRRWPACWPNGRQSRCIDGRGRWPARQSDPGPPSWARSRCGR